MEVPTEAGEVAALAAGSIAFEAVEETDVHGAKLTLVVGIFFGNPSMFHTCRCLDCADHQPETCFLK